MRENLSNSLLGRLFRRYRLLKPDLARIGLEIERLERSCIQIESMFFFLRQHWRNSETPFQLATRGIRASLAIEVEKLVVALDICDKKHRGLEIGLRIDLAVSLVLIVGLLFAAIQSYLSRVQLTESTDKNKDIQQDLNIDLLVMAMVAILGIIYSQVKNTAIARVYSTFTEEFVKELTIHRASFLPLVEKLSDLALQFRTESPDFDKLFTQIPAEFLSGPRPVRDLQQLYNLSDEGSSETLTFAQINDYFSVIHAAEKENNRVFIPHAGSLNVLSRIEELGLSDGDRPRELLMNHFQAACKRLLMSHQADIAGPVQEQDLAGSMDTVQRP